MRQRFVLYSYIIKSRMSSDKNGAVSEKSAKDEVENNSNEKDDTRRKDTDDVHLDETQEIETQEQEVSSSPSKAQSTPVDDRMKQDADSKGLDGEKSSPPEDAHTLPCDDKTETPSTAAKLDSVTGPHGRMNEATASKDASSSVVLESGDPKAKNVENEEESEEEEEESEEEDVAEDASCSLHGACEESTASLEKSIPQKPPNASPLIAKDVPKQPDDATSATATALTAVREEATPAVATLSGELGANDEATKATSEQNQQKAEQEGRHEDRAPADDPNNPESVEGPPCPGEASKPFVNEGLLRWEAARKVWLSHHHKKHLKHDGNDNDEEDDSSASLSCKPAAPAIPLDVDEIIDVIFASPRQWKIGGPRSFPQPVPLPQLVDLLQDLWEAEGIDP